MLSFQQNTSDVIEKAFPECQLLDRCEIKIVHLTKKTAVDIDKIKKFVSNPDNGFPEAMALLSKRYIHELCNSSEETSCLDGVPSKGIAKKISKSERILKFNYDGKEWTVDRTTNKVYDKHGTMVGYRRHDEHCIKCKDVRKKTDKKNVIYDEHKCWIYIEFL